MNPLEYALSKRPIVASVTKDTQIQDVEQSRATVAFLLHTDIMSISGVVARLRNSDKLVLVHLDLMTGIARDASGIAYLAEVVGVDGIVTTRSSLISTGKQSGLITIQRTFLLDSVSVDQAARTIHDSCPDAVELLPGPAIPYVFERLHGVRKTPIIAGGLLSDESSIRKMLDCGCIGVSTSTRSLW